MNEHEISAALTGIPLGGLRFFSTIGSTNDEALAWAIAGAKDWALVVADAQTAGRGRMGRAWQTPPASALAFSVVLRPGRDEEAEPSLFTGLGALALLDSCRSLGLEPRIKWPNDLLLQGAKAAGILVESVWSDNSLQTVVIGIGVNVGPAAVPLAESVSFPATSVEQALGRPVDRLQLLQAILQNMLLWRSRLGTRQFVAAWEAALAFRGETVRITREKEEELIGTLVGLESDGSMKLQLPGGPTRSVHMGEIQLRPMNDRIG